MSIIELNYLRNVIKYNIIIHYSSPEIIISKLLFELFVASIIRDKETFRSSCVDSPDN